MAVWASGSREDLGVLLDYIKENVDRLIGDGTLGLADAVLRMSADDGILYIDSLPETDIAELWGLVNDIAKENGAVWEVS